MANPFQLDEGAGQAHEAHRVSFDALLKFVAALMTFLPFVLGWTGDHPFGTKILAGTGILILLWIAKPYAVDAVRWLRRRSRDRGFVAREDQRPREFLARFVRFVSPNDGRSIVFIVNSICANNHQLVPKVVSHDYVGTWLTCFQQQLNTPPGSLTAFLSRCQEFAHSVDQFNRNYVQRNQRHLTNESLQSNYIDQLEEFRDEFNDFVRELESWSGGIGAYLRNRQSLWRLTPTSFFERMKTFRLVKTSGS